MKRNLLSILALFLLVLPLTGCGEDEKVNVSVSLVKQEDGSSANDFSLDDCASITGGGEFEKGDSVTVTVHYVSDACKFGGFRIEETQKVFPGIISSADMYLKKAHYTFSGVNSNMTIKAIMTGLDEELLSRGVYFDGVAQMVSSDGGFDKQRVELDKDTYMFPIKSAGNASENKVAIEPERHYAITQNTKLINVLTKKDVDLRYIYVKDGNTYNFVPYELQWKTGTYATDLNGVGICNYSTGVSVPNSEINTFEALGNENICVTATYDPYAGNVSLKNNAVETMLNSKMFVSTSSDSKICNELNDNCYYVENLKNLYISSDENLHVFYHGVTADKKNYEAVYPESINQNIYKYYYICPDKTCDSTKAKKILFPSDDGYLLLNENIKKLKDVLDIKDSNGTPIYGIANTTNIKLDYNNSINQVVPIEIIISGQESHYMNYKTVGTNTLINLPDNKMSNKYNVKLPQNEIDENLQESLNKLQQILDAEIVNQLYDKTLAGDSLNSEIRLRFANFIDENSAELGYLKNYLFTFAKSSDDIAVTVTKKPVSSELLNSKNFILSIDSKTNQTPRVGDVCVYLKNKKSDNDGCDDSTMQKDRALIETIMRSLTMGNGAGGLNDDSYELVIIETDTENPEKVIYSFTYGENKDEIKVTVESSKIFVEIGKKIYELRTVEAYKEQEKNISVSSIKSSTDTVIGTVVQSYDYSLKVVKTEINGTEIDEAKLNAIKEILELEDFEIDDVDIKAASSIIKGNNIYKVGDKFVLVSDEGVMYEITTKNADSEFFVKYSDTITYEITYTLEEPQAS